MQPPKAALNHARLIIVPEIALELGKELGSGAFGTVYKVNNCVCKSLVSKTFRTFL